MLGTADIIAQMSDRCYLEKCRDRLYPGVRARRPRRAQAAGGRTLPVFASGDDLVQQDAELLPKARCKRLDLQLARAYEYAARHFGGPNLYLDEMQKNVRYAQAVGELPTRELLRRTPPTRCRRTSSPTRRT